eukprot:scpid72432/ scgid1449/ 
MMWLGAVYANASLSKMRRNWLIEAKHKLLAKSCLDDELLETGNLSGEMFSASFQSMWHSTVSPFCCDTGTFSGQLAALLARGSSTFGGYRPGPHPRPIGGCITSGRQHRSGNTPRCIGQPGEKALRGSPALARHTHQDPADSFVTTPSCGVHYYYYQYRHVRGGSLMLCTIPVPSY